MDNWLNYHHLYYFRTIATEGSIAKAATKLRLGQPTLSAQLRQLEDKLGISLFDRHHKKLTLTEHGRMALNYANEIFRMGAEMMEVLRDQKLPSRIHVQLGALDSVPKSLIYRLVKAAYQVQECSVTVLEGKDDELVRELTNHKIDLILTNHLPSSADQAKLYSRRIAQLPVIICGAPKFKELKKDFPKSLHGQSMIWPTYHSKLRSDLEHFFELAQVRPSLICETQDAALQKILGSQGIGLIALPRFAARSLIKRGDLFEIGPLQGITEDIYLVSSARKIENPVSSHLWKNFQLS